jgi:hypothetical protein
VASEIQIEGIDFRATRCRTRLPFRFGIVTLTEAPVLVARLRARVDGVACEGFAADLCVPKWFEKDPHKSVRDDVAALFRSAERAATAFSRAGGTPFGLWHGAYRRCLEGDLASGVRLVDGFGVALVERAMIDATCRAADVSFATALGQDRLGFEAAAILPELAGEARARSEALVARPAPTHVLVRHTVGGLDPLRSGEVSRPLRGDDDHPVALEEDIARFGLRTFKLKAGGTPEGDTARLCEIVRVVEEAGVERPIYSLDANESYDDVAAVGALLDRLEADPDGRRLLEALAYLEQPLPRARTLDPATTDDVRALAERVPLLIDEADDAISAFSRATAIGYAGVSVKNCKGVFRALANRALILARDDGSFQTSEDLTNLPVLPLQQDLATVAALGLEHSERNGHHFFPGLDVLPEREAEAALAAHPDLYERRGDRIVLRIEAGALSLACAGSSGYGYACPVDWEARRLPGDVLAETLA